MNITKESLFVCVLAHLFSAIMENYQHGYSFFWEAALSKKNVTVSNAQFATGGSSHALLTYEEKKHTQKGKKENKTLVLRQLKTHGLELNHFQTGEVIHSVRTEELSRGFRFDVLATSA